MRGLDHDILESVLLVFNHVAEFHEAFGHPIGLVPQLPDSSIRALRVSLIKEELEEYCTAFACNDRVEMADALADLLFVLAGTAVAYGIAPKHQFESPYDGVEPLEDMPSTFDTWLWEDFSSYLLAESGNDLYSIKCAIDTMMLEILLIARQSRIPINAVFAEVHRSNLSKLMPDGSVLRREDGKILKGPNYSPPDIKSILEQHHV